MSKYERVDENNVKVTKELSQVVSIQKILKAREQLVARIDKAKEQCEAQVLDFETDRNFELGISDLKTVIDAYPVFE